MSRWSMRRCRACCLSSTRNASGRLSDRARPQRADQSALGVRPQELFLSGLAAGLPDQPVQVADRGRGRGRWSNWTAARPRRSASSGCIWSRTPASCCTTRSPTMSYVDLNRCGVALMEIVSKPDIRDAEQAKAYVTKLRSILRYLGTCDGDMEKGSLARRRQRLRAQAGRAARHPLRDQEHELDQLHRPGDRVRGAAPDRDHRGWRRDRPGNAAVRPQQGRDALDALQGRGARLSLFPGSRPAAARVHASLRRRAEGEAAGIAGPEEGPLHRRLRPVALRRQRAGGRARERGFLRNRAGRSRRQGARRQARGQLGDQRAVRASQQGRP